MTETEGGFYIRGFFLLAPQGRLIRARTVSRYLSTINSPAHFKGLIPDRRFQILNDPG